MADTLESEFIFKFHSLSGITLAERHRNLYLLLNETQRSLELAGRKIDLSSLHPTTPLEESFKVKALIHFKCVQALSDVLKTENCQLIAQVLKHSSWFVKEAFDDITPECLTTQIFPNVSYSTKEKLLGKLSYVLDTQKSDKYFEAIKETYGLYLATKLLSSCSCDLIMKCIELYKTEVTSKQLLIILKKWPSLTELILQKLHQQDAKLTLGEKYQYVFKYLAKNDVNLFIKLYQKYSPCIRLGTKETNTFIKSCVNLKAFSNAKICAILKDKQIAKSFGNDFKEFYYKTFPKCMNMLHNDLDTTLELLVGLPSDSAKLNMFSTTFKRVYGNEIWEYSAFKIPKLIEWMDPNDREVFLQNHSRPIDIWEETWISYHKSEKSVPLLKEKIPLLSSIKSRTRYIIALLKTCKINRDTSALLDVLRYINAKHRNENFTVLQDILTTLNNSFNAKSFTEEHWVEINLCVQYFMLNNNNNGYYYYCRQLSEKYIFYRLSQNLSVTEYLEKWAKQNPDQYNICQKNSKFEKICLANFEALVPLGHKSEDLDNGYLRYFSCVREYNKRHPKNKLVLSMKDEYLKYIRTLLEDNNYSYMAELVASDVIIQNVIKTEEAGILKCFFNSSYYLNEHIKVIIWLYKTNPTILLKYFNLILLNIDNRTNYFRKLLKRFGSKYTHLKMPETISKLCYDIIKDQESDTKKFTNAVVTLSVLSTPQEYLAFSSLYYPSELSPNIENNVKQNYLKRQQTIVDAFANLTPLSQTWEGILPFCKGDYLKFAQRSFVLASVHTVENKLPLLFDMLKGRAVSVRKHVLFLSSKFLNIPQVYDILLEFMQKEKNTSIRRLIFKTAFRMFLQKPNDYSWKLSTQCIEMVDISFDEEALDLLTNCRRVPLQYFAAYMKFTWSLVDKGATCNKTIIGGKSSLLNLVSITNILTLSSEFCMTIIENNLFKCEQLTDLQKAIQSFTCKYLIYGRENQEELLKYIFGILKNFHTKNSDSIAIMATKYKLVYNFITQLCSDVMDKQCSNKVIFDQFLSMWESTLQPFEACDEFIYLQLTSIYLTTIEKTLNIVQIGEKVTVLCDLLHKQNCLDVDCFSNFLKEFLEHFYSLEFIGNSDENQIALLESIVNNRSSYICLELIMPLYPCATSISPTIKQRYDNIINILLKEPNNLLQVGFQSYLKNRTDSDVATDSSRNF